MRVNSIFLLERESQLFGWNLLTLFRRKRSERVQIKKTFSLRFLLNPLFPLALNPVPFQVPWVQPATVATHVGNCVARQLGDTELRETTRSVPASEGCSVCFASLLSLFSPLEKKNTGQKQQAHILGLLAARFEPRSLSSSTCRLGRGRGGSYCY